MRIQYRHRIADQGREITESFVPENIIFRPSEHLKLSPLRKTIDLRKSVVSISQNTTSKCPSLVIVFKSMKFWFKKNWSHSSKTTTKVAVSHRAFSHITCVKCTDLSFFPKPVPTSQKTFLFCRFLHTLLSRLQFLPHSPCWCLWGTPFNPAFSKTAHPNSKTGYLQGWSRWDNSSIWTFLGSIPSTKEISIVTKLFLTVQCRDIIYVSSTPPWKNPSGRLKSPVLHSLNLPHYAA